MTSSDAAVRDGATEPQPLRRIRLVLALLASATAVGGLVELAMLRHWDAPIQLLPWMVLVVVAVVGVLTARGGSTRLAQATGLAALLTGGIGVLVHLLENLDYGDDLAQYAQTWEAMPFLERLWLVLNGTVTYAPTLAPGMVALSGVILFISVLDRR
ncbi:hypothetical protein GA707_11435 [Nostocoides sp. F2B08]|uniref:hypothetical protein n=1 Tax=Nostocoides sp. F2B08 TaxID=2653936 RepID=UPI001262DD8E|nr:hypothetical protein [Tetrasphaera sp. F2B08]KAB7744065.1 hypothetical protein GA707_11435 [Tetrasphaera sp. F2B08]